MVDNISRNLN